MMTSIASILYKRAEEMQNFAELYNSNHTAQNVLHVETRKNINRNNLAEFPFQKNFGNFLEKLTESRNY